MGLGLDGSEAESGELDALDGLAELEDDFGHIFEVVEAADGLADAHSVSASGDSEGNVDPVEATGDDDGHLDGTADFTGGGESFGDVVDGALGVDHLDLANEAFELEDISTSGLNEGREVELLFEAEVARNGHAKRGVDSLADKADGIDDVVNLGLQTLLVENVEVTELKHVSTGLGGFDKLDGVEGTNEEDEIEFALDGLDKFNVTSDIESIRATKLSSLGNLENFNEIEVIDSGDRLEESAAGKCLV